MAARELRCALYGRGWCRIGLQARVTAVVTPRLDYLSVVSKPVLFTAMTAMGSVNGSKWGADWSVMTWCTRSQRRRTQVSATGPSRMAPQAVGPGELMLFPQG
ncbi:hypothetical protein Poly30_03510 [Planctomycetes bacterium Poly30]|uniref:Uncharacterized protein n=1 Tax=Saltatorellus ferox TaxID=2528018 RepID=A0A518EL84_9BACT|nr:hypothetical protein Poly30_03510 [Planctomycetes bacterium Poly30]